MLQFPLFNEISTFFLADVLLLLDYSQTHKY